MTYNRKFLFGLLALVFLLACTKTQTPEQRAKDATVLIITVDAAGSIGSGSGFFVEPDKIATNIHVVAGERMLFAVGTKKVYNIEKVVGYNPELDLVVLQVSGKGKPLELGEGKIGDTIFAVGYPGGGYTRTEGIVHDIRKSDKQLRLTTTDFPNKSERGLIAPGSSGGPVLNSNGQVIGIVSSSYVSESSTRTFSFSIASGALQVLLRSSEPAVHFSQWQGIPSVTAYIYGIWADKKSDNGEYEKAVKGFDKAIELYPDYAEFYVDLGLAKSGLGSYQEAIQEYGKAIELISDDFNTYNNQGSAKLEIGDYAGGIRDFDKALELNPDHLLAYFNRGTAKVRMSEPDYVGAIQDYTEAIDRNLKNAVSYHSRGNAKQGSKDYDGAIDDYTEAIRLKDDFVDAYLNRGIAKAEKPEPDYVGAIQDYTEAIDRNLKDAVSYHYRGNAKQALGQDENAKRDYALAYYYGGKTDSNSGNYQAAIEKFDEAIALDPNYVKAHHYRGDAYRLRGQKDDFPKAIADYDKVVALNPDYTEIRVIYNNLGLAKVGLNNYDEAIDDYTEAIGPKSNYAEAYYNRGDAYRLRGQKDGVQKAVGNEDFKKAVKDYTAAINLKNNFADAHHKCGLVNKTLGQEDVANRNFTAAHLLWGDEAYEHAQYQEAIDNYNEILKLNPSLGVAYNALGNVKSAFGTSKADLGYLKDARDLYQEAIEYYNKAIGLNPGKALYYKNRGLAQFRNAATGDRNEMIKDYELAIEYFTKAIKREADMLVGTYNLRGKTRCMFGYAKANQGNSKEARKQYNLALKDFKKAIEEVPNDLSYHKGLGLANAALGKAKAAINAFEKAKQLEEAKSGN